MGWLDSNFTYKSGDKPKYKVGDKAYMPSKQKILVKNKNLKEEKKCTNLMIF